MSTYTDVACFQHIPISCQAKLLAEISLFTSEILSFALLSSVWSENGYILTNKRI